MDASERRKRLQELKQQTGSTNPSTSAIGSGSGGRRARLTELKRESVQAVVPEITSRVNTWLKNNEAYFSNAQNRFSGENTSYRADTADWLMTVASQRSNFQKEAENIKSVLNQHKDIFGQEYVDSVVKALDGNLTAQESIIEAANKDIEYWSQWANEDEYNTAVRYDGYRKKYEGKSYEEIKSLLYYMNLNEDEFGEEGQWLKANQYKFLMNEPDFEEYSQKGASIVNPSFEDAEGGINIFGWRPGAEEVGNIVTYSRDNAAAIGLANLNGHSAVGDTRYSLMSDDEVSVYNYYLGKFGEEKAAEFLSSIEDKLTEDRNQKFLQGWQQTADEHPVFTSAISPIFTAFSAGEYLGDLITGDDRNMMADVKSTIRGTVSEKVNWEIGNWDAFDFLYNTGMSMADSVAANAAFGPGGGVVLGLSAAAEGTNEALDRGLSKEDAFWHGLAAGVFEGVFETWSIGKLKSLKEVDPKTVKDIAKNLGKTMLTNASEEALTEIANITYDLVANGDLSSFAIKVQEYMEQGMSEAEARHKAAVDLALQVVESGASGALMGLGMGGGVTAGNAAGNSFRGSEMKKAFGSGIGANLATEALEIDPSNPFAQKMQTKLNSGGTLSNRQVGKLVQQNEATMYKNDVASIRRAVEERLAELGEKGDVKAIATALTKQVQGERLTFTEREAIKGSKFGQRVANELNTENIQSGEYSSSWAEKIGTDRINADEYSRLIQSLEAEPATAEAHADTTNEVKAPEIAQPTEDVAESAGVATQETTGETQAVSALENVTAKETATEAPTEAEADESAPATLESESKKYGAQAGAMMHTYNEGQNVVEYDAAYSAAYNMGKSGVNLSYAMQSESTAYLTEEQRKLAHAAGVDASNATAKAKDTTNKEKANGKTGRKKGVVKGRDVSISDLKKAFNDTQNVAYKLLSRYAEATGIDIVLFKSEMKADGDFEGAQGWFKGDEDTIYIDINAGLADNSSVDKLAKYTMMRTFAHEFTHFIEKWNPIWYNEFRKVVFDTITERGGNVEALIAEKQEQNEGMSYDKASREVVAEAMVDILPDANFIEELATKHKTIFEKLLEMLKEFVADLKAHFASLDKNSPREANALKEHVDNGIKYVENIVKMFDKIAVEAVENYQMTVATEEVVEAPANVEATTDSEADGSEFTITDNREFGTLEIKFEGKPSEAIRNVLKEHKFRWHGKKQIWYGKGDRADIVKALREAYQNEAVTEEPVRETQEPVVEARNETKVENAKPVRTKKSDWASHDVEWGVPGKKTPIAYSTRAASDLIEALAEDNPSATIKELLGQVTYDVEAKKVLQQYIDAGYGNQVANEWFNHKKQEVKPNVENADNQGTVLEPDTDREGTASEKLANKLLEEYINEKNINQGGKALTSKELYAIADEAFGGTQAEGAYNRKDAYDAMELAVNKFLLRYAAVQSRFTNFNGTAVQAVSSEKMLARLMELLPTQNVRTQEMEDFQQFSTPPNIAYLAAWAANISNSDFVLEPSAGIGGLAVFAKAWGAEVAVNELSKRRLEVLRSMGFDHLFNENAEHIDNILPDSISPSVVIMNPPFSSTAGRTANNKTSNAEKHIDQALARLRDGGRLVAVLGKSMNNNDYYKYWDKLRKSVNIRANLSIDGDNYKKYGTTWGVQIVIIDKTGPQTGETVTGRFSDLTEVPKVLEVIRNDRSNVEENRPASRDNGISKSVSDGGNRQSDTGHKGSSERATRGSADGQRTENRESDLGNERAGNRTDGSAVKETGGSQTERQDGGADREAGRTDLGDGDGTTESSISDRSQPEQSLPGLSDTAQTSDDGVYATFVLPEIPVAGGKRHPAVLVESAAMAAVSMPKATYKVKLPTNVIKNNLSDAQLVTITYAGQAHEQKLADGRRKGFFVGDGTGVGKGRQIAGIILDNFMQGRNKAVWISKNNDLYGDAIRDWTATTGRSKDEVISHNKIKSKDKISLKEGILYSTYDTLKSEKGGNRLEQIVEWLGEDFDGVIAFDEAHNMGNLFGKKGKFGKAKGSEKARAGVELQRRLPNARIVYVSATAATEVDNLAYAERIGLWGQGTAFANAQDFISKIGSSGLAAMELVIRDMKAMGVYVARSISYNGVNYDTVEHALDPMQTEIYNTMSRAWQKTMSNVQSALETTGGRYNSTERQRALGNFYSGMQRFYNQVLTSMSMPSVIADMRRELEEGHSCVLQIVNTNEAQQNKQLAEAKASGESLDNLDLTPREALLGYLMNSFPTTMFEEYTDDDGNLRSRPVIDSAGNPVQSKEAIRQRDALVSEVNQMSIPDGPLEMLFDAFGPEMVAENTGRSRRVVPKKKADGSIARVEESRTLNHRTADVQAFQDGKKRILVFSDAGGTGKSYHADRTEKNQQLRIHYVLQPGWVASNAVQGFGRTHRSNEASAPVYKLVTTNIKGQKRFTSTIARRLDQLGALTKGQRDTGSGMFGAKDNLETDLAKDSLREFYRRLGKNQIEGVNGMKTLDRLGLKEKFTDEYGSFKLNDNIARDISTFLNRILALEVDEQNIVFDAFISIYEMELEAALQSGTLDTGMENVKADKVEVVDDKVIRKDDNTGSETHYIQAKTYTKPKVVTTVDEVSSKRSGFIGVYKTEGGAVKAVFRIADKTTEWGAIQKQYRLVGPNISAKTTVWNENTLAAKAKEIDKTEWQREWDNEVKRVPEYNEDTLHMLTGALLPIWNSLPQEGSTKVKRLIADSGDTYLGRVIDKDLIDGVLGRFDIDRTKEVFTAQQVMDKAIDNGVRFYLTNNRVEIFRSRVSGEWRLEVAQPYNAWYLTKTYPGLMQERIQYRDRYFIPVGEKGIGILEKMLADNPVRSTADDTVQEQSRSYLKDNDYSTDGVHWGVEAGVMTNADARVVWEAVVNIKKKGYKGYQRTIDGDYFVESNNLLMVVDADYHNPLVKTIYQFNDDHETNMAKAKELLKNEKGNPTGNRNALRTINALYGDGYVEQYDSAVSRTHAGQDGRREGANRGAGYSEAESRAWDFDEQYQERTNTLSDREVLAFAADRLEEEDRLAQEWNEDHEKKKTTLTAAEKDALRIFKQRLSKLEALQDERKEQGQLYKEQQFGENVDREAAKQTLNRMQILDEQIKKAKADVLSLEDKQVFESLLKKARKVVEAEQRTHDAEVMQRYRERTKEAAAVKKYRNRILSDRNDLIEWLNHPMDKNVTKHVNENVKDVVIDFLLSIDPSSVQKIQSGVATRADLKHDEQARKLLAMLNNLDEETRYSGEYDLPLNFESRLKGHIETVTKLAGGQGDMVLNRMTSEELKELSVLTANLKTALKTMNKFHANAMFAHVTMAGDNTVNHLKTLRDSDGNAFDHFTMWKSIRPDYVWSRFGKGGISIGLALRKGQNKLGWNAKTIIDFAQATFTEKECEEWENKSVEVTLSDGRKIKVTVAALMSFYELSKRKQGRKHILDGGVTVSDVEIRENKKKKRIKGRYGKFTETDINIMNSKLTDRQKEVADKLQQFMEKQGGEWGNHVTLARFGEKAFGEAGYFPISVDKQSLSANNTDKEVKGADLYRLLNMGFTKELSSNAKQPLMLYSIFDVFSTHMADMAQYNAMALPVLDAIRWLNYKNIDLELGVEKSNLRAELRRAFGAPVGKNGEQLAGYAESFVVHILQAYNGTEARGTPEDAWGVGFMHRYNRAQIAYNMRVVMQQPMALTRAALVIKPKYITKALDPTKLKANIKDMLEHSGIAVWKDLGYYDINISRGLTQMIKQDETWLDKVTEIGMKPAELADKATWAVMWYACKLQLAEQGITDYEQINALFDDVIYKTQVVDSVLTKSQYMRDKGFLARTSSAFMSEAVTTASMVLGTYDEFRMDMRKGASVGEAWRAHKGDIGRTVLVYSVSAILLSMVQAVADAFRDDDDYEEWYEKWLEALGGNLLDEIVPLNKLPLVSYLWDTTKIALDIFTDLDVYGNPPESVITQWVDTLRKAWEITNDLAKGEGNYTLYAAIYKYLQVASGASGLPVSAGLREVATVWNNTFGSLYPDLKLKTYDSGDKNEIKYAYQDGYLTDEEAVDLLLEQGLVDNEDEAYFTVQGWEAGDGYSRYDKLDAAIKSGTGFNESKQELLSHGITEKDIHSRVRTKAGEWYRGGEISKQQATNMLTKYTDMDSEEITKLVNQWSAVVVTGIEYEDIGDEFKAGRITASRAIEMYMRYGGMTKDDATKKVSVLSFVKEHPSLEGESVSYSFVEAYTEYCEPMGIDVDMAHDVLKFKGSAESDEGKRGKTAKEKVMEYIDSLGLSRKQKDALYYACGYAKSTIKEAPWR